MSTSPTTPIRIALCITELDPGGAEQCLVELALGLDRRRFEAVVYCLGPRPRGNPTSLADRLEQSGLAVHCFGGTRLLQFPWIIRALTRRMKADSPQIVQSFLFHANFAGSLAAKRAGVPHVVTGIRVAERRHNAHLLLARWADRWVERHVCVSQSVRDLSATAGRLPADKLVVIPNGVDVERFAAAKPCSWTDLGLPLGRSLITLVGRLDEQKGVAWLIELMPEVLSRFPDHDLVIVGTGSQRADLERLAQRLGLARRVRFLGYRQDVAEILAASDLLVLPSRWEGMPNVVLEAMAAGKPVIATDVEGVREALGSAATEQVVPIGDGQQFVAAICRVVGNPELAGHLGLHNRLRAQEHFRLKAMIAAYERLYLSLAAK